MCLVQSLLSAQWNTHVEIIFRRDLRKWCIWRCVLYMWIWWAFDYWRLCQQVWAQSPYHEPQVACSRVVVCHLSAPLCTVGPLCIVHPIWHNIWVVHACEAGVVEGVCVPVCWATIAEYRTLDFPPCLVEVCRVALHCINSRSHEFSQVVDLLFAPDCVWGKRFCSERYANVDN